MVIQEQTISEMCHWPWDSFSSYLLNKSLTLSCWSKKGRRAAGIHQASAILFCIRLWWRCTKGNFLSVWLSLKRGNYLPLPSVKRGLTVGTQKKTSCDEWKTVALLSVYSGRKCSVVPALAHAHECCSHTHFIIMSIISIFKSSCVIETSDTHKRKPHEKRV